MYFAFGPVHPHQHKHRPSGWHLLADFHTEYSHFSWQVSPDAIVEVTSEDVSDSFKVEDDAIGVVDATDGFDDAADGVVDVCNEGVVNVSDGLFDVSAGIVDAFGGFVDASSRFVDDSGGFVDASGGFVDVSNGFVDDSGTEVDETSDAEFVVADVVDWFSVPWSGVVFVHSEFLWSLV